MKNLYLSVVLILISLKTLGQQLVPPIQNHTSVEYDGASQNWGIAVDDRGLIYAANDEGLLSYDGQRWELFPLKNGATIRSVLPHNGRIYTGSYREFGYWKRDLTGEMTYTSLIPLAEVPVESEEFWEIIAFEDAIYFRSFGAIYKYQNDKIIPVKKVITNKMVVYNNSLLIAVGKEGLYYLESDGTLEPLPNQKILNGKRVLDIEVDGQNLIVGTKDRLFEFNGEYFSPFRNKALNNKLAEFEFNHIMKVDSNELILATVRNGVLHHDLKTGNTITYNRESGLQNNTILTMAEKEGTVWLGLDNGIDQIDLKSPIKFFTDHTGELGAVYDLTVFDDQLYAASNTGIYTVDNRGISMIEGSQGHSWNLEILDNILYSNHNSGTLRLNDHSFIPIENRTGSFQILRSPNANIFFIGNYTGISVYNTVSNSISNLPGLGFPVKKILFEDPYTIWAEHANEGVYRIGLNNTYTTTTSVTRIDHLTEVGTHRSEVFRLNDQIGFLKNKKWYRYNKFRDELEVFDELRDFKNHNFLFEDEAGFWFTNQNDNSIIFTNFRNTEIKISYGELGKRSVKGNERMIKATDSIYYLTLKDGFARIDLHEMIRFRKDQTLNQPFIKAVFDAKHPHNLSAPPTIPYPAAEQVTIHVGLSGSDGAELRYNLRGSQNLKGKIKKGILAFQNLPQGDYQLDLFALNPQGLSSDLTSLSFTVEAPWYLSLPMKALYVLLLMGTMGFIYLINNRKLKKHRLILEQKIQEEHKEHLERLEKKRLQDDIMLKRKELANTTMMAAKKNEVLMDIQGELNKDRENFSNQYRIKHIMNKINQAIQNKDEWQVFETNFREVHEDFSKDLLERYPNLTGKDLKLCSYLKMNLTSKEIAPLMGKSVRGVEVHRYRLRKKMELDSQENLSAFLIKNF